MAEVKTGKKSVLFVCLGNICRSPMAEGVFLDLIKKANVADKWVVDSAAVIDFHVGKAPDKRTMGTLTSHGITDYKHRVRQVTLDDFHKFDYIFGMDNENIADLKDLSKESKGKAVVDYLGSYDPRGILIVPDPYYSRGTQMFEQVYEQCVRCCQAFLEKNHEND